MAAPRRPPARRHREVPDPLAARVGERIRRFRRERDFSFDAFVEETGLGRGYVSELERGLVVPTIAALAKAAKALGVTIADLVLGDSPREQLLDITRPLTEREVKRVVSDAKARAAVYETRAKDRELRVAEPTRDPKR